MNGALRRPLPPGGIDRAVGAGRRLRRRRTLGGGMAAACAAAAVVAGVLSAAPTSSVQRIEPDGTPTSIPAPIPTYGPAVDPSRSADLPSPASAPDGRPASHPTGVTAVPAGSRAPGSATPAPGAPVRDPGPGPSPATPSPAPAETDGGPVMAGPGKIDDSRSCQNPVVSDGLDTYCTVLTGAATVRAGASATFTYWICRRGAPVTVSYPTRQEAEFTVTNEAHDWSWRWSRGFAFPPRPHQLTLETGYCYSWAIEWAARDARGAPLRAGTYVVTASGTAYEWADGTEDPDDAWREISVVP